MDFKRTDGKNKDFIENCRLLDMDLDRRVGKKIKRDKYKQFNLLDEIQHAIVVYENDTVVGGGAIWYWMLCVICAYRKSYRMGINSAIWVLAAVFFHIGAVAVLYFYAMVKGTCENCGRLKNNHGKFCDRCGKSLKKECSQCGQVVDVKAGYCSNCGKKLHKGEK